MEVKKRKKKIIKNKKAVKKPTFLTYRLGKTNKTIDESVPIELLLSTTKTTIGKPQVKTPSQPNFSPFVVSLLQSEKTLEENPNFKMNFAVSEKELILSQAHAADFQISREELLSQFLEEEKTPFHTKRLSRPHPAWWPSVKKIRTAFKDFSNHWEIRDFILESFDTNSLFSLEKPHKKIIVEKPEEIAIPFDLPDFDNEPEESEILTLDDILRSTSENETIKEEPKKIKQPIFNLKWSWKFPSFPLEMLRGWQRAMVSFVLISFLFVLPLHAMETIQNLNSTKINLLQNSSNAVSKLNEAVALITTSSDSAATSFHDAKESFSAAQKSIDRLGAAASFLLSILPPTKDTYKSGASLVAVGENMSEAGEKISQGVAAMQNESLDTTGRVSLLLQTLKSVLPLLEDAEKDSKNIDPNFLPNEYKNRFTELQTALPGLINSVQEVTDFSDTLLTLLGSEGKKRYLLLFQNNTELRPTGGFLGSFAVLDISRGEITNLSIPEGGSYDLQGSLKKNYIAPLPLQLLSARWEFQDSNWFPDFPTSARQALQFFNEAGGPTVDGVLAVNATFISSLLNILGPVEMEKYERTIDSENFIFETQKIVETEYPKYSSENSSSLNAPKAFIGDLATILMEKVKTTDTPSLLKIIELAYQGLQEKDVQIYFPDEKTQKIIHNFGWDGAIEPTDQDYLMIVNTNLGGGKTDGVISEKNNLDITIQEDGRIINTLTITRTHNGIPGSSFTGVNNVDFLRIYVPKGSHLLSATGFTVPDTSLFETPDESWLSDPDILYIEEMATIDPTNNTMLFEESGKTVFGNWVQVKPGDTATITFVYELPFQIKEKNEGILTALKNKVGFKNLTPYSLFLQKQAGVLQRTTTVNILTTDKFPLLTSEKTQEIFTNSTDNLFTTIFTQE